MLSTAELLALLDAKKIQGKEVAECLRVANSAVTRIYSGERALKLDEAKKIVDCFGLVEAGAAPEISPLSEPVSRLLILYAADYLGVRIDPEDPRVAELARDFRAFSTFAADPRVRENADAAGGFLQGMRLGRDQRA